MTRISFIMPTFNRAHFIAESLRSILSQAGVADEILVIDDGSTDGTAAVVEGLGGGIRYVRQDNAGKSTALNRALAVTDGEFVWICDDDDLLRPGAVHRLLAAITPHDDAFVFGRYTRFRDLPTGVRTDLGTGYWPDLATGTLLRHILEDAFVMQNAALVRRSAYQAVGGFDEAMLRSLDYDMFVRLALRFRPIYLDTIVFDQRKHEGARGPARVLHAAGRSDEVWQQFDRRIFEKLHPAIALQTYEDMFDGTDPALLRRAALLQRACVSARHQLWAEAVRDLEDAARHAPGTALQPAERAICGRILAGKHGIAGALTPDIRRRLRALYRRDPAAARILRQTLSSGLWRLRLDGDASRADMRRMLRGVAGAAGTCRILLQRVMAGRRACGPSLLVWERTS